MDEGRPSAGMPEPMKVYREFRERPSPGVGQGREGRFDVAVTPSFHRSRLPPSATRRLKYAARFVLELQVPWTARKIGDRRRLGNVPSLWQVSYVAPLSEDIDLK